ALIAPKGSMIIHAADRIGVAIPRFCYHDKLPIAANCRMCLVDVEKSPKPLPACATPVMEGMKIATQSARALDAQRNVMEFLLINHPLDCPICDQGGECELQDVAMGYGRSVSRFVERKRVVPDENLGPLISTDMTRCIHCTRCVRFVSEISGTYELGGMGRGENLSIGTYIGKAVESELSGNVIDVCPVGALTNKVFRFRARPWELIARESVGYHDALGSNLWLHVRRGEVLRCVPRENEPVNECWLSDRDRYSHQALIANDRLGRPLVRNRDGALVEASWDQALKATCAALQPHTGADIAALVSPMTSSEEGLLLARLMQALGSDSIDHRLRKCDLGDQVDPRTFAMPLADIERANAIFLIGSDPRREQPLLAHRIRKAALHGAKVFVLNAVDFGFNFDLSGRFILAPHAWCDALAEIEAGRVPAGCVERDVQAMRDAFAAAANAVVIIGDQAVQHAESGALRAACEALAGRLGARCNELPQGANAIGLTHVGARPGRRGRDATRIVAEGAKAVMLYGCEPEDFAQPAQLLRTLDAAELVIAFAAFAHDEVLARADIVLPIGLLPEIEATLVNVDGRVQRTAAGSALPGEARAGWRVLRALGAQLGLAGFEFTELSELRAQLPKVPVTPVAAAPSESNLPPTRQGARSGLSRIANVPIYRVDAVVRRAAALQATALAAAPVAALHPEDASALGLVDGMQVTVAQGEAYCELPLKIDARVARGAAWIPAGFAETGALEGFGSRVVIAACEGVGP
ncbi:MAG: NADH-quinone oxidoreductase subunit NuoG, partial [Lysobacterales bacterium]